MSEFFEKSLLSGAGKHPDFQVTLCLQNVSTDAKFDDWWKHQTSNSCRKIPIFKNFKDKIGISIRCFDFNQEKLILEERRGTNNHVFVQIFNKVALKAESLDSSR